MVRKILLILFLLLPYSLLAETLVVDLTDQFIEIDTNFNGKTIMLFGTKNAEDEVFVAIRGPKKNYLVRKKAKTLGVWLNSKQHEFDNVASFYSFAREPNRIDPANDAVINELGMSLHGFKPDDITTEKYQEFRDAFNESFEKHDLYNSEGLNLELIRDTLFKVKIAFPKNITSGTYLAETYLLKDGQILALQTTPIIIEKVGFDDFIYRLAYERSALYGLIGVFIALFAGYIAGNYFRRS